MQFRALLTLPARIKVRNGKFGSQKKMRFWVLELRLRLPLEVQFRAPGRSQSRSRRSCQTGPSRTLASARGLKA